MIRIKKEIKMEKDSSTNNYKEDNDEPTSISHLSAPMPSTKDGEKQQKQQPHLKYLKPRTILFSAY